jgi:hypothetical protein
MPMPKGHKMVNGYSTTKSYGNSGMDYRKIAVKMSQSGSKMNHATAHKVFMTAMIKIAKPIHEFYNISSDENSILKTINDPRFQSTIIDLIENFQEQ